ncbi:MAG: cytochrome c-type biogenesis protein CcmH [Gammaproteobacteria bacterium]|nr:cytochrome c-type biogenesis protein CcmH [Gammaproteobacteria bacterium]MCP5424827.1 cytochrome c-type biogenesis protein CcmH [Gammaproteobacteria bacterium]MCP5458196.1 cytochrome c-type biogenesis protein CcmH [Gammaproteobacteria bacterium]
MKAAWLIWLVFLSTSAWAAIDAYQFDNPQQEQQFRQLTEELRCPKCQNQNIADSNAPLSHDLRQRVYEMVKQGHPRQDIIDFMVARYGDFVTYRPPVKPITWVLWFGPFTVMALVALSLFIWLRRREPRVESALSEADRERLGQLLHKTPEDRR